MENHKPVNIVFPSDMMLLKEETVMGGKAVRWVATEGIIDYRLKITELTR